MNSKERSGDRGQIMENKLYVVIPCYNEEEVLPETSKRLKNKLEELMEKGKIDRNSKIVFVNDGSKDRTWEIVEKLHEEDHIFSGINLSRNRGHQNALLAGLMTAKNYADMVVSMDADLQDDINAVDEMVEKYLNGIDIVYGVRSSRAKDTFFKKATAEGFYKLMNGMGANTVFNHADYRLMSRRALEGLAQFGEVNLFLRGIVPMIGYRTDVVYYERGERFAGESKYPLGKMLSFADPDDYRSWFFCLSGESDYSGIQFCTSLYGSNHCWLDDADGFRMGNRWADFVITWGCWRIYW